MSLKTCASSSRSSSSCEARRAREVLPKVETVKAPLDSSATARSSTLIPASSYVDHFQLGKVQLHMHSVLLHALTMFAHLQNKLIFAY
eukprot:6177636-Pleurochrysis_carterae.AAC.1